MSKSPEFAAYAAAKQRCGNENDIQYKNYGGRGIEFKFDSFKEFILDIGQRPSRDYSLDRIDNMNHYQSGNIQWSLNTIQQRNKRNNHLILFRGEEKCIKEWSEITDISTASIYNRLIKLNWCIDCTLTIPPNVAGQPKLSCPHR